jgi:hypothetical protein
MGETLQLRRNHSLFRGPMCEQLFEDQYNNRLIRPSRGSSRPPGQNIFTSPIILRGVANYIKCRIPISRPLPRDSLASVRVSHLPVRLLNLGWEAIEIGGESDPEIVRIGTHLAKSPTTKIYVIVVAHV